MPRVRFGVWLLADRSPAETAEQARLAEEVGLDFVGVTDGQMIWRDVYVSLTAAAFATKRVSLGPWVTNPVTRHPAVTANAICTLDEMTGGRAFLGIGAGDDSVKTIDLSPATSTEMGDAVSLIRSLAGGKAVPGKGQRWRLATARPAAPPIYWAAANTKSFQFGGRFADGVIDTGWLVPDMLDAAVADINEGARQAGRQPDEVTKIFNSGLSLGTDGAAARAAATTYVAKGLMYRRSVAVPGWSEEQRQQLVEKYDYYQHLSASQSANSLVPEELITKKAIAGTPDEAIRLLEMVMAAGYVDVALMPVEDVSENIRLFGEQVVPRLR